MIKDLYKKIDKFNPFTYRVRKLNERVNNLESQLIDCKDRLIRASFIENKMAEYNTYLNRILYENDLNNKTKIKDFNPLVSIIIPAYNASKYLAEAINCALNQTYKNIEVIVVNDGSKDDGKTDEVAKSYKDKIKYYSKENGGVSSALNYGIDKMNGDYFVWLSHDDLISDTHVEKLVEFISYKENKDKIPYTSIKFIDEFGNLMIQETISAQFNFSDYKMSLIKPIYALLKGEINGGAILIPKKAFDKVGLFDEKQRISQERDMWDRLFKEYDLINIPYSTSYIRCHSSQVTNTNPNILIESNAKNLDIIKNLTDEQKRLLEETDNELYVTLSYYHKQLGNKDLSKDIKDLKK